MQRMHTGGGLALASCSSRAAMPAWGGAARRQQLQPLLHRPCSVSYNSETIPPPPSPPPPPPPPPQQQAPSRREVLQIAAFGGAGLLAGVVLGRRQLPAVDPELKQQIDQLRADAKFKRDYEGHVFVQARDGSWFEVKTDAKLSGTLLLRDQDGFIYTKVVDAQQVDLSEDFIVAAIFGDGAWEATLSKVQGKNEEGVLVDAVLDEDAFRDFVSIRE